MSYAAAAGLQAAIYQHLVMDAGVVAAVGTAVFDTAPTGPLPDLYVVLGAEEVRDASDYGFGGASHDLLISVVASTAGFLAAKEAAQAICDALIDAPLGLPRGHLISLRFLRAAARQADQSAGRRIDLRFRARVEDDG